MRFDAQWFLNIFMQRFQSSGVERFLPTDEPALCCKKKLRQLLRG